MAGLTLRQHALLAGAALVALTVPLWLLREPAPTASPTNALAPLAAPAPPPPLRAAFARTLFAPPATDALPADTPELLGVVGRLGRDAVAMVRGSDGTRTLSPGDSIDGWQLRSLAIDAAYFTRGGQSARVPMPGSDDQR
ncbi:MULTISPECIES: hypothetical protein [Sphingomonas]|jgi:hypothetical protein|uniref:Type II secretion system protein GspC N-terminal domain-containing protein n=1 Tax=Sphingomonas hankookensis TaxID=563996 RepID=A0ABR5YA04_9SPHN|nr:MULTISPECIES: hypothetical protein [Sphingomonas]KZE09202.1 hypothetical protein AVT10_07085 [Sphingomonas hankookensis]WCP73082.1 hypothetical protein PPZ50_05955 [Sphingomonas hankookensis]